MRLFTLIVSILIAIALLQVYMKFFQRRVANWFLGKKPSKGNSATPEFVDMATHYRNKAASIASENERLNLLGMAALWEHDSETAISLLEQALDGAIGNQGETNLANNLALAYLQAARYRDALNVLDQLRLAGSVKIRPYTLSLIGLGDWTKARNFYRQHGTLLKDEEVFMMDTVMSYNPTAANTLQDVRQLIERPDDWWLYLPVLRSLISTWELEVFFSQPDRYDVLSSQGKSVLERIEADKEFFRDARIQWLRSVVSLILPRCETFHGCASLFGIVVNLDTWMQTLDASMKWRTECELFWRRVVYTFTHTVEIRANDIRAEMQFIQNLLPADGEPILRGHSPRCEIYRSHEIGMCLRVEKVSREHVEYHYVDWTSQEYGNLITIYLEPLLTLIDEHEDTSPTLEPLMYAAVCYPGEISATYVQNALSQLATPRRERLFELGFSVDTLKTLPTAKIL